MKDYLNRAFIIHLLLTPSNLTHKSRQFDGYPIAIIYGGVSLMQFAALVCVDSGNSENALEFSLKVSASLNIFKDKRDLQEPC